MPQIVSQRDARAVKKLPFCYLCGNAFQGRDDVTDDHIPPQAAFLQEDREDFPLVLPAHKGCNHVFNLEDEVFGQLIGLGHETEQQQDRLTIYGGSDKAGHTFALLENFDLRGAIQRWVMAFHAALYQEPLPPLTRFSTQTPIPAGTVVDGVVIPDTDMPQFLDYAEQIEINAQLGLVDCIRANNGSLTYQCCWQRSDGGPWLAFYKLDVYAWSQLGDIKNFRLRPCVGAYATPNHIPALATRGTELWSVRT
jgi:hypothetical protein